MYKENDFVRYIGESSTYNPIEGTKEIAKILSLEKTESYWHCELELLGSKETIFCYADKVKPLETEEKHLLKIGFKLEGTAFVLNDIIISAILLNSFEPENFRFLSGLCIADFRNSDKMDFNKYLENGKMSAKKFYRDFPNVGNLNDLFNFLETKGYTIDKEVIAYV